MNYNKKFFKNHLESIEIPEEVDFVIDRAIKRAKNRHKKTCFKVTASLSIILVLFIFLNKTSPVFANYINNASKEVRNLLGNFRDKGIDNAIQNGFVQDSVKNKKDFSQSAADKGITITIDQFTMSGNELLIGYSVKADSRYNDWDDLMCDSLQILDNNGRILFDGSHSDAVYSSIYYMDVAKGSFKNSRIKKGIFHFSTNKTKISKLPDSITIKFYDFYDNTITPHIYKRMNFFEKLSHKAPKIVNGNWQVNIKVDDKLKNAGEINYIKDISKDINSVIKIDYVNVYPTVANAKFLVPVDMNIKSVYLEDDNGSKYKCGARGSRKDDNSNFCEETSDFESPYFEKVTKLYLVIKGEENNKEKNFKIALEKK
ncbi:MAG: DUF4179 domain-containing protein [Clostridium sp.]|jgi:hypothetical protein|uniref:DUF4179 domain-containing protein n=1 Tax=Clostridium sp. TaxID=1506 RepID=UPI0025BACBFD|nr:DUF4179 domain-containing protein [Clostridium sp.]MCH3963039.1 DUF4179 domain-containing protein [Clostridium sp.]MCI1716498.1 DUF4179 domain-containing protein [Clostridium sp.]MCI1800838.1 DUF4179 domain-containing protein [Clostridium sp.]MCI1814507.1 DUF4179 domain-containing protein [Clostridium sp.]MCI1871417.1 DUF4179 domain-containing protein [Clostridium sp.]